MIMQRRVASLKPYRKAVLVPAGTPVSRLVRYYTRQNTLNHLCVLSRKQKLLGIISRRAVFEALFRSAEFHITRGSEPPQDLDHLLAEHIMQKRFISVTERTTLQTALDLCLKHHLHELPVLDQSGHLLGFITTSGITRHWYRIAHCTG